MKLFFTSILILIFVQVSAHESDDWCDSKNIKAIGQVTMTASVLRNLDHGVVCSIPVVDIETLPVDSSHHEIAKYISNAIFRERQHGELDDLDVEYMSTLAYGYCSCSEYSGLDEIDPRIVRPEFLEGNITSLTHHDDFRYSEGVSFSCNICRVDPGK
jgi:hypothetical protein